jgi:hypothetical protein
MHRQHDSETDSSCAHLASLHFPELVKNINVHVVSPRDSRGPVQARAMAQQQYRNQTYYMQIDAHTRCVFGCVHCACACLCKYSDSEMSLLYADRCTYHVCIWLCTLCVCVSVQILRLRNQTYYMHIHSARTKNMHAHMHTAHIHNYSDSETRLTTCHTQYARSHTYTQAHMQTQAHIYVPKLICIHKHTYMSGLHVTGMLH